MEGNLDKSKRTKIKKKIKKLIGKKNASVSSIASHKQLICAPDLDPNKHERGIVPITHIESENDHLTLKLFQHFIELRTFRTEVDLDFVAELLENGLDINKRDIYGQSILHESVRVCREEVTVFLIKNDADIFCNDNYNFSILHTAAGNNRHDIIDFIFEEMEKQDSYKYKKYLSLETHSGQNCMHFAAKYDHFEMIAKIHERDPDLLESKDKHGRTPLMLAAGLDRHEAAKKLLKLGADPAEKNLKGEICLTEMIEEMPDVAVKALDCFTQIYRTQRKQHFRLQKFF